MTYSLYKLDLNRNVLEWAIDSEDSGDTVYIITYSGRMDGKKVHVSTPCSMTSAQTKQTEIDSKIRDKKKAGWKSLDDIGIQNATYLEPILKGRLPYDHKDLENRYKPQKAILFQVEKFKYPAILQPKLNGVRVTLSWSKRIIGEGLFIEEKEGAVLASKEGIVYFMPHITDGLTEDFFRYNDGNEIIDLTYDGELYKHGMKLNEIRKRIPYYNKYGTLSKPSGNPKEIAFWCFDLAIPNILQDTRITLKDFLLINYPTITRPKEVKRSIVNLGYIPVHNDEEAIEVSKEMIEWGYEGGILRDVSSPYGFGSRDKRMMKLKKWFYTKCTVLDIIEKRTSVINDKERTYIAVILRNDLNQETFECTPEGDEDFRVALLLNKDNYIGKLANVKFRERSGIANVPFQAVVTEIQN